MSSYKTLGGDRTHNLPVRSRTPYPFGHEGRLAEDSFDLSTFGLWAQRASTAPLCLLSCQDAMLPLVRLEV